MTPETLGTTGQILVSQAAARQYAAALGLQIEQARRELTVLLADARRSATQPHNGTEGWRVRSRALRVDVSAQVAREPGLAVVTTVGVSYYRPARMSEAKRERRRARRAAKVARDSEERE